eukprot:scaffold53_cov381-Pavlova_lutheri.AAC.16
MAVEDSLTGLPNSPRGGGRCIGWPRSVVCRRPWPSRRIATETRIERFVDCSDVALPLAARQGKGDLNCSWLARVVEAQIENG